ncbi:hypothetical protein SAMN05216327_12019 [Dyadobacter sp. SG02]|uniref:hypothetical protein n=1 Tax=Dyadobacter sp. SG02 TaxID=1855291 RepID=UPI0008B1262D|nr:hypothetical protein [Dyadobacter sp. SG02]SEJ78985.1 hypothetical protein SAMN05216327_12019 [Dyadobacter sp. SG02]
MKKISFDDLIADLSIIESEQDLNSIRGGDTIYINGGYIVNSGGNATFYSNNGTSFTLPGATVYSSQNWGDNHYQLSGGIYLDPNGGADVSTLIHEYGHYLQQQQMGTGSYIAAGLGSAYSVYTNPGEHASQPFEVQATNYGYQYIAQHYPGFVY